MNILTVFIKLCHHYFDILIYINNLIDSHFFAKTFKFFNFLKILNLTVCVIVLILAIFILVYPNIPELHAKKFPIQEVVIEKNEAIETIPTVEIPKKTAPKLPKENRIVISRIKVNALIVEGKNEKALDKGMWRIPFSSTPDQGGNTVITGHRFLYTSGPNTLFYLNNVRIKDDKVIYWKGKKYTYKVYSIKEYSPDHYEIEFNTKEPILTLYTCTPLWTSLRRLVVRASLIE